MKIHRFIVDTPLVEGPMLLQENGLVFQIQKILKLQIDEQVTLTNGHGAEGVARITEYGKNTVFVHVEHVSEDQNTKTKIHGYVAILKKDNFELAVQKMTEIGITDITPVISTRTIKKNYNHERLQKIIKEAIEQSGQNTLSMLHTEKNLLESIKYAKTHSDVVIVFDELDTETKKLELSQKSVSFFVGPEGGWTTEEKALFSKEGVIGISLGDTTLRGETAAIVGTFWVKERQK